MIVRRQRHGGACVALQVALFVLCSLGVVFVRHVVGGDTLSVAGDLALTGLAVLLLGSAAAIACLLALSPVPSPRVSRPRRLGFFAIPIGLIMLGGLFVKASYADVSVDLESILRAGEPPDPETVIVLGPGGEDVRLSGQLSAGAAGRLDALLNKNPTVKRIHLTSEGGLADEGQAIGDVIAAHGLTTYVPDYCVSACTLAFVRGTERLLLPNSRLGFHAPFEEGLFGTPIEGDSSVQRLAYLAAGIEPAFVTAALAVPASDLWIPEPERLIGANVATGLVDTYRFPDSNLDGAVTSMDARALVLRNFSILAPFEARSPTVVDRIASWYHEAYRRGLSEGEVLDGLKRAVRFAVSSALTGADDATLVQAARTVADAMASAAATAPADCLAIGVTGDAIKASHYLGRFVGVVADALAHPLPGGVANGIDTGSTPRVSTCAEARGLYAAVLRGPDREVASFMRRLLAGSGDVAERAANSITRASMISTTAR